MFKSVIKVATTVAFFIAVGTSTLIAQTCTPTPGGLVAWYRAQGNANDSSGNANHGTLQGGATFAAGHVGQAFSFDGVDDSVVIPDSPSVSVSSAITVEAWFRPDVVRTQIIFSKYNSPAGENSWFLAQYGDGSIQFLVSGGGFGDSIFISAQTNALMNFPTTSFTHVVGTFDVATNTIKIFINGVQVAVNVIGAGTVPFIDDNNVPVYIGRVEDSQSGALPFDGTIDEASLYNRALSATEIQAIFSAGTAGKCIVVTAAAVEVGGRVLADDGRGIAKARLSLTDAFGITRSAQTNAFGYYRFEGVSAGEVYIIAVQSKRFEFAEPTRVISVTEALSDVDFTALPPEPAVASS